MLRVYDVGTLEVYLMDNVIKYAVLRPGVIIDEELVADEGSKRLAAMILNYVRGEALASEILSHLDLPQGIRGEVLLAVMSIPKGRVASYGQIGALTGAHPRAVGRIISENAIPIIIPCHRVVRSSGELGGYSYGADVKARLLLREGVKVVRGRVRREHFVDTNVLAELHLVMRQLPRTPTSS